MKKSGFTLIELLVVIVIIGVSYAVVSLQISQNPINKARDDIRKSDINALADAYTTTVIGDSQYRPLNIGILTTGKIPTPPEGGQYQGLLTEPQDYFFICAQLEKGKDLNCLVNSENPNCYCRKSKDAPIPSIAPSPSVLPTSTPIGVGTTTPAPMPSSTPSPTSTPIPTSSPTPTPSAPTNPPVYSELCIYENVPQTKPTTVSLEGVDGSWCFDSEGMGQDGNYSRVTSGYCVDNNHNCADFCENNYPGDNVRDGYCTGNWWGAFWSNVHCEFGGYECSSWGQACNEGQSQAFCDANAAPLPSPTPLPQDIVSKRVFKTSTVYNGNLGGLSGADQKCQGRANAASLGGAWKAWLSDGTSSASQRLNHFTGPYTLLDGIGVADNWTDLTDGSLDRNINMTEFKVIDSNLSSVWTGTDISGNSTDKNCANWTVNFGWPYYGGVGSGNSTLSYWTKGLSDFECSSSFMSLYCFEQ